MSYQIQLDLSKQINEIIKKIVAENASAGKKVSSVVTKDGKVQVAGQINGKIQDKFKPLEINDAVKSVVTDDKIYILTDGGYVYSFDTSRDIHCDLKEVYVPISGDKAISIQGGKNHVLILTKKSKVYGAGSNSQFQLVPKGRPYYERAVEMLVASYVAHDNEYCDKFRGELKYKECDSSDSSDNEDDCDCDDCCGNNKCGPKFFASTLTDSTSSITINNVGLINPVSCSGAVEIPVGSITLPVDITFKYYGTCCCPDQYGNLNGNITFQIVSAVIPAGVYLNAGTVNNFGMSSYLDITTTGDFNLLPLLTTTVPQTYSLKGMKCSTLSFPLTFALNPTAVAAVVFTQVNNTMLMTYGSSSTIISIPGGSVIVESAPNATAIVSTALTLTLTNSSIVIPCCPPVTGCSDFSTTFAISTTTTLPIIYSSTSGGVTGVNATLVLPVNITGVVFGNCCTSATGALTGTVNFKITDAVIPAGTATGYYASGTLTDGTFTYTISNNFDINAYLAYNDTTNYILTLSGSCSDQTPFAFPAAEVLFTCLDLSVTAGVITISTFTTPVLTTTLTPASGDTYALVTPISDQPLTSFTLNPLYYIPCCTPPVDPCVPTAFTPIPFMVENAGTIAVTNLSYNSTPALLSLPVAISGYISGTCCINSAGVLFGELVVNIDDVGVMDCTGCPYGLTFPSIPFNVDIPLSFSLLPILSGGTTLTITLDNTTCASNSEPVTFMLFTNPSAYTITNSGSFGIQATINGTPYVINSSNSSNPLQVTNFSTFSNAFDLSISSLSPYIACCPCTPTPFNDVAFNATTNINIAPVTSTGTSATTITLPVTISGTASGSCCLNYDGTLSGTVTYTITGMVIPIGTYPNAYGTNTINLDQYSINLFNALTTPAQLTYTQNLNGLTCANANVSTATFSFSNYGIANNETNTGIVISINGQITRVSSPIVSFSMSTTPATTFGSISATIAGSSFIPCCPCVPQSFSGIPFYSNESNFTISNLSYTPSRGSVCTGATITLPVTIYGTLSGTCCVNANGSLLGSVTATITEAVIEQTFTNGIGQPYVSAGMCGTNSFDVLVNPIPINLLFALTSTTSPTFSLSAYNCNDNTGVYNFPLSFTSGAITIANQSGGSPTYIVVTINGTSTNISSNNSGDILNITGTTTATIDSFPINIQANIPCCNCTPTTFNPITVPSLNGPSLTLSGLYYTPTGGTAGVTTATFPTTYNASISGNCCLNTDNTLFGSITISITSLQITSGIITSDGSTINLSTNPFDLSPALQNADGSALPNAIVLNLNGLTCDQLSSFNYPLYLNPSFLNSTPTTIVLTAGPNSTTLSGSSGGIQINPSGSTNFLFNTIPIDLQTYLPCCSGSQCTPTAFTPVVITDPSVNLVLSDVRFASEARNISSTSTISLPLTAQVTVSGTCCVDSNGFLNGNVSFELTALSLAASSAITNAGFVPQSSLYYSINASPVSPTIGAFNLLGSVSNPTSSLALSGLCSNLSANPISFILGNGFGISDNAGTINLTTTAPAQTYNLMAIDIVTATIDAGINTTFALTPFNINSVQTLLGISGNSCCTATACTLPAPTTTNVTISVPVTFSNLGVTLNSIQYTGAITVDATISNLVVTSSCCTSNGLVYGYISLTAGKSGSDSTSLNIPAGTNGTLYVSNAGVPPISVNISAAVSSSAVINGFTTTLNFASTTNLAANPNFSCNSITNFNNTNILNPTEFSYSSSGNSIIVTVGSSPTTLTPSSTTVTAIASAQNTTVLADLFIPASTLASYTSCCDSCTPVAFGPIDLPDNTFGQVVFNTTTFNGSPSNLILPVVLSGTVSGQCCTVGGVLSSNSMLNITITGAVLQPGVYYETLNSTPTNITVTEALDFGPAFNGTQITNFPIAGVTCNNIRANGPTISLANNQVSISPGSGNFIVTVNSVSTAISASPGTINATATAQPVSLSYQLNPQGTTLLQMLPCCSCTPGTNISAQSINDIVPVTISGISVNNGTTTAASTITLQANAAIGITSSCCYVNGTLQGFMTVSINNLTLNPGIYSGSASFGSFNVYATSPSDSSLTLTPIVNTPSPNTIIILNGYECSSASIPSFTLNSGYNANSISGTLTSGQITLTVNGQSLNFTPATGYTFTNVGTITALISPYVIATPNSYISNACCPPTNCTQTTTSSGSIGSSTNLVLTPITYTPTAGGSPDSMTTFTIPATVTGTYTSTCCTDSNGQLSYSISLNVTSATLSSISSTNTYGYSLAYGPLSLILTTTGTYSIPLFTNNYTISSNNALNAPNVTCGSAALNSQIVPIINTGFISSSAGAIVLLGTPSASITTASGSFSNINALATFSFGNLSSYLACCTSPPSRLATQQTSKLMFNKQVSQKKQLTLPAPVSARKSSISSQTRIQSQARNPQVPCKPCGAKAPVRLEQSPVQRNYSNQHFITHPIIRRASDSNSDPPISRCASCNIPKVPNGCGCAKPSGCTPQICPQYDPCQCCTRPRSNKPCRKRHCEKEDDDKQPCWNGIFAGFDISILRDDKNKLWALGSLYQIRPSEYCECDTDSAKIYVGCADNAFIPKTITIYNRHNERRRDARTKYFDLCKGLVLGFNCETYKIDKKCYDIRDIIVINTGGRSENIDIYVEIDEPRCHELVFTTCLPKHFTVDFTVSNDCIKTGIYYGKNVSENRDIIYTYIQNGDVVKIVKSGECFMQTVTADLPTVFNFKHCVLDVAVGDNDLTVLAKGNRLYGLGENERGQLGLGDNCTLTCWRQLNPGYFYCPVTRVFAGTTVTFYITEDFRIYASGYFRGLVDSNVPIKLKNVSRSICAKEISASESDIIIVGNDAAYGFGSNAFGQLGFDSDFEVYKFVELINRC